MRTEVVVAMIGAVATIVAALIGYLGTRPTRPDQRRGAVGPVLIGVVTIAILVALGGWVYAATRDPVGLPGPGSSASPSPTGVPVTYPSSVEEYSEQLVTAWGTHDAARLAQLATAKARNQLTAITGSLDQDWNRQKCTPVEESASQYCPYLNRDGDVLGVVVQSSSVGKAQAVVDVQFDRTTYPTDTRQYVQRFLDAWRAGNVPRLRKLAVEAVVGQIGEMGAPTGYTIRTEGAAGHTYVSVDSSSVSLRFDVSNQIVAQARPQAIRGLQIG